MTWKIASRFNVSFLAKQNEELISRPDHATPDTRILYGCSVTGLLNYVKIHSIWRDTRRSGSVKLHGLIVHSVCEKESQIRSLKVMALPAR